MKQSLEVRATYPKHVENPSFLAVVRNRLYAVNELPEGGAVTVYDRNEEDGELKFLSRFPTEGAGMCHVTVWPDQRHISMANYNSGSAVVCALDDQGIMQRVSGFVQHYGTGYDKNGRQEGPHVHSTGISQDGRFLYTADLGLDQLFCYCVKEDGSLELASDQMQVKVPAGEGPRNFCITPDDNYILIANQFSGNVVLCGRNTKTGEIGERISELKIPQPAFVTAVSSVQGPGPEDCQK